MSLVLRNMTVLLIPHIGTSPSSTIKTSLKRKSDTEAQTTASTAKTTESVHIVVEKKTSSTPTPEPTGTTLKPTKQATNAKISTTPSSTEKTSFVVKVGVEQEQEAAGVEEKDKEKSEGVFVVQKVTEVEKEKQQTAEEPIKIKVSKVANDETDWDEEADLESGTGKGERPNKKVGNAAVTTPVTTAESGFKVEKITPSPSKSTTKSSQIEVVKVERVSSKVNVESKRSSVERIEEDEDLKVSGAAPQSPDKERKVEITVEKESTETSSAKEPSPAKARRKDIIVEVKKVSPSTEETDEEVKEVEVIVKPTAKKESSTIQGKADKVSISVEKITPSQRPTSGKSQTSMVKVVKVNSEDEDLQTSRDEVNYKRSDDASEKTSDSEEEALEMELEGGQDKTGKDKIDEQKLAQEFDKALEAERKGKENKKLTAPAESPKTTKAPQVTTGKAKPTTEAKGDEKDKQLEKLNDEAALEKVNARKVLSDEELELAELAEETMNDEDKEEVRPTEKPTKATSQATVIKVEKVSKVTVQVTKERNENLLSEEETAKEEKELKDELANELEQEKEGVSIRGQNAFQIKAYKAYIQYIFPIRENMIKKSICLHFSLWGLNQQEQNIQPDCCNRTVTKSFTFN